MVFVQYIILTKRFAELNLNGNKCNCEKSSIIESEQQIMQDATIVNVASQLPPPSQPFAPIVPPGPPMYPLNDPVKIYDYHKLNDPLEEPTKRVDRYLLGPIQFRRMFNYPVRGDPDNPRWLGLLVCESDDDKSNKLIKLFGRQKYPGADHYEYYTMINMGNDQVKVRLHRKKELYDDDTINIPELNKTYKVKINKEDDLPYNPYF
jgi:hypothetical protein